MESHVHLVTVGRGVVIEVIEGQAMKNERRKGFRSYSPDKI